MLAPKPVILMKFNSWTNFKLALISSTQQEADLLRILLIDLLYDFVYDFDWRTLIGLRGCLLHELPNIAVHFLLFLILYDY